MVRRGTLSFGVIAVLLAFMLTVTPAAANAFPAEITGVPIPSQGKEGDTDGQFRLYDIVVFDGTFTAMVDYCFDAPSEPGKVGLTAEASGVEVVGVYQVRDGNIALRFSSTDPNLPFRGQLTGPPDELWGFINTPGNGFVTQVFVMQVPN